MYGKKRTKVGRGPRAAILLSLTLIVATSAQSARGDTAKRREYQVKAAFQYNFLKFVEWPKQVVDSNVPITIGIIGEDPFGKAFEPLKNKLVDGKKVVIKRFKGYAELAKEADDHSPVKHPELKEIRKCRILFITRSEKSKLKQILKAVCGNNVLTIADMPGFLEAGGMINFLLENKKVRFEINAVAAEKAKLDISSQLLRLAKRVIKEESEAADV